VRIVSHWVLGLAVRCGCAQRQSSSIHSEGTFWQVEFGTCGVPHRLAWQMRPPVLTARRLAAAKVICETEIHF